MCVLVELENRAGERFFINAAAVAYFESSSSDETRIVFQSGMDIYVPGSPIDISSIIQDEIDAALKAAKKAPE